MFKFIRGWWRPVAHRTFAGDELEAMAPPGAHVHRCVHTDCKNHIVCYAGDDHCTVNQWECPEHEHAAYDAWLEEQEAARRGK